MNLVLLPLDNHDQSVSVNSTNNVDTSLPGIYNATYTATDNSGNTSTVLRTINVENNNPPSMRIYDDDGLTD